VIEIKEITQGMIFGVLITLYLVGFYMSFGAGKPMMFLMLLPPIGLTFLLSFIIYKGIQKYIIKGQEKKEKKQTELDKALEKYGEYLKGIKNGK